MGITMREFEIDLAATNLEYYVRLTPPEQLRVPEVMAEWERIDLMRELASAESRVVSGL